MKNSSLNEEFKFNCTRATLVLNLPAFENKKNTQLLTVSMETVPTAKS